MGAIALQTTDGTHLGFMLMAGEQEPLAVGAWAVDCIRVSGEGDGRGARLRAVKAGKVLYVHLDDKGLGEWGVEREGAPVPLGRAFVLPARAG